MEIKLTCPWILENQPLTLGQVSSSAEKISISVNGQMEITCIHINEPIMISSFAYILITLEKYSPTALMTALWSSYHLHERLLMAPSSKGAWEIRWWLFEIQACTAYLYQIITDRFVEGFTLPPKTRTMTISGRQRHHGPLHHRFSRK